MGDSEHETEQVTTKKPRKPRTKVAKEPKAPKAPKEKAPKAEGVKKSKKKKVPGLLTRYIVVAALDRFNEKLRLADPAGLKVAVTDKWIETSADRFLEPHLHKAIRGITSRAHQMNLAFNRNGGRINGDHMRVLGKLMK